MGKNGNESSKVDRRDLIKKAAAGAAAAGVVWSAPKVEGLSLRPSYAAAGSAGGAGQVAIPFVFNSAGQVHAVASPSLGNGNAVLGVATHTAGGMSTTMLVFNGGPSTATITSVNVNPPGTAINANPQPPVVANQGFVATNGTYPYTTTFTVTCQ